MHVIAGLALYSSAAHGGRATAECRPSAPMTIRACSSTSGPFRPVPSNAARSRTPSLEVTPVTVNPSLTSAPASGGGVHQELVQNGPPGPYNSDVPPAGVGVPTSWNGPHIEPELVNRRTTGSPGDDPAAPHRFRHATPRRPDEMRGDRIAREGPLDPPAAPYAPWRASSMEKGEPAHRAPTTIASYIFSLSSAAVARPFSTFSPNAQQIPTPQFSDLVLGVTAPDQLERSR